MFAAEYKHYLDKRIEFFATGDPDTPLETYHSIMIEDVPPSLRSKAEMTGKSV